MKVKVKEGLLSLDTIETWIEVNGQDKIYIYIYIYIYIFFFSPISWYPIGSSYSLVSSLQLPYRLRRGTRHPKHNPTKPHCFLTQRTSNPEARHTNVSEETQYTWRPGQRALRPARQCTKRQGYPCRPNPPLTRTMLGQLRAAPWVSRSWPAATEPKLKPGSLVAQLAL